MLLSLFFESEKICSDESSSESSAYPDCIFFGLTESLSDTDDESKSESLSFMSRLSNYITSFLDSLPIRGVGNSSTLSPNISLVIASRILFTPVPAAGVTSCLGDPSNTGERPSCYLLLWSDMVDLGMYIVFLDVVLGFGALSLNGYSLLAS